MIDIKGNSPSFRSRLLSVGKATVAVVSNSRGVGGTVALSTGLDPDDGVEEGRWETRGGWSETESGLVNVAPVTPLLADVLDTGAALVDDEVSGD